MISAKLHYTDTGYGHQRTPPTDELTTILQLVVQEIHHQRTKSCHIWHCDVANLLQNCCELVRWWCSLVVLYNMSVAGVRVVEFGPNVTIAITCPEMRANINSPD